MGGGPWSLLGSDQFFSGDFELFNGKVLNKIKVAGSKGGGMETTLPPLTVNFIGSPLIKSILLPF